MYYVYLLTSTYKIGKRWKNKSLQENNSSLTKQMTNSHYTF